MGPQGLAIFRLSQSTNWRIHLRENCSELRLNRALKQIIQPTNYFVHTHCT